MSETDAIADDDDECIIPAALPPSIMGFHTISAFPYEEQHVKDYVLRTYQDEEIVHLELLKTESVMGDRLDAWDVWGKDRRYWVITKPMMNVYEQEYFRSLDYTISFHIGLMLRMTERQAKDPRQGNKERLLETWRRFYQAVDQLNAAEEAFHFQAVGNSCRDCLLALLEALRESPSVKEVQTDLKSADFIHWTESIADIIAGGSASSASRSYLKTMAKSTWQLISWLVHARNATRIDGFMALSSTDSVISAFETALTKHESKLPDRCPSCNSYRVTTFYDPDLKFLQYVNVCQSCDWRSDVKSNAEPADEENNSSRSD
jgi:hypothetical protein